MRIAIIYGFTWLRNAIMKRGIMRSLIIGIAVLIVAVFAAIQWLAPQHFTPGPADTVSGKALVGGPLSLVDHDGQPFTEKRLKGNYSLVYFGFTHCPDICPTSLLTISHAINALEEKSDQVVPVFISLDPERDTPEKLKPYVSSFHPRMIGLTGSPEQVKQAADAYKVYFSKVETPESALGYLVDHSGFIYLMGPTGEYITHFPHNVAEQSLTATLRQHVH